MLYILTISDDGGVPVHFRVQSGNTTDDRTHQETWELLCELAGRRDFLYVADCKLATAENMAYLHQRGGRFLTVLPKTRGEDQAFREVLRRGQVAWRTIHEKTDEEQPEKVLDRFSAAQAPAVSAEGYRLLWFHSTRKAELDAAARAGHIQRATRQLDALRQRLTSPRTRYRQRAKVADAVEEILRCCEAGDWVRVQIEERTEERYHQDRKGRPGKDTRYVKEVSTRFDLSYQVDHAGSPRTSVAMGSFPW